MIRIIVERHNAMVRQPSFDRVQRQLANQDTSCETVLEKRER